MLNKVKKTDLQEIKMKSKELNCLTKQSLTALKGKEAKLQIFINTACIMSGIQCKNLSEMSQCRKI